MNRYYIEIAREMLGLRHDQEIDAKLRIALDAAHNRCYALGGALVSRQAVACIIAVWEAQQ